VAGTDTSDGTGPLPVNRRRSPTAGVVLPLQHGFPTAGLPGGYVSSVSNPV
jgi:hypothetical protein